jgi:hypothetical protein
VGGMLALLIAGVFAATSLGQDSSLGNCIRSTPPDVKEIGPHHVRVEYRYKDECAFPARTFVDRRAVGHKWTDSNWTVTQRSGIYHHPRTRDVTVRGLNGGKYQIRSGITYFGTDVSSPTDFTTEFHPARDLKMVVSGYDDAVYVQFFATTSPGGTNVAEIQWGRSDSFPASDRAMGQEGGCDLSGRERDQCKWTQWFNVGGGNGRGPSLTPGVDYTFRVRPYNLVYEKAYGPQRTKTVTVRVGQRFPTVFVGEDK